LTLMEELSSRLVDDAYGILSALPTNTVRSLAVVGEFNARKETMLALAALAAAERCSDDDPSPWSKPLRRYLLKGHAGAEKSIVVIMGYGEGHAPKDSQLRIGDLVTGVKGPCNDKYKLEVLRFDDTMGDFRELPISESNQLFGQWQTSPLIKGFGRGSQTLKSPE